MLALANGHVDCGRFLVRVEADRPSRGCGSHGGSGFRRSRLFRELFPGEVLSPGQLISLDTVTLVVTDFDHRRRPLHRARRRPGLQAIVLEQFRLIDARVRLEGGGLDQDRPRRGPFLGLRPTHCAPQSEPRLALPGVLADGEKTKGLALRGRRPPGVGDGRDAERPSRLLWDNRLDRLEPAQAGQGRAGRAYTHFTVASDPSVVALLEERKLIPSVFEAELDGLADRFVHRIEPGTPG